MLADALDRTALQVAIWGSKRRHLLDEAYNAAAGRTYTTRCGLTLTCTTAWLTTRPVSCRSCERKADPA